MLNKEQLKEILAKHKLWLSGKKDGKRANLCRANLSGANLSGADLSGADLSGANLFRANLFGANLRGANLFEANLRGANLSYANLFEANLRGADLRSANLLGANLSGADLLGANFSGADLLGADLSGATGLLSPIDYLKANFERTNEGFVAYKVFGLYCKPPKEWNIAAGAIIEENVNPNRTDVCGCGINVATKNWIKNEEPKITKAWKLLIKWEGLAGVVVPYNTDGKIRCERAMLLEEVEI